MLNNKNTRNKHRQIKNRICLRQSQQIENAPPQKKPHNTFLIQFKNGPDTVEFTASE